LLIPADNMIIEVRAMPIYKRDQNLLSSFMKFAPNYVFRNGVFEERPDENK